MARKYALNLIDSVLKHRETPIMSTEIKDIAKRRYGLDGAENERMLSNIARNIAYDNRFSRQDFLDPNTNSVIGSEYCSVKMKDEYRDKDASLAGY